MSGFTTNNLCQKYSDQQYLPKNRLPFLPQTWTCEISQFSITIGAANDDSIQWHDVGNLKESTVFYVFTMKCNGFTIDFC
jgi:hypothetical protein